MTCVSADGVSQRQIFDKTIQANQLNVVEAHGILLFRAERGTYTSTATTQCTRFFPLKYITFSWTPDAYTIRDVACAFTLVYIYIRTSDGNRCCHYCAHRRSSNHFRSRFAGPDTVIIPNQGWPTFFVRWPLSFSRLSTKKKKKVVIKKNQLTLYFIVLHNKHFNVFDYKLLRFKKRHFKEIKHLRINCFLEKKLKKDQRKFILLSSF